MKRIITSASLIYVAIFVFAAFAITSCTKQEGHLTGITGVTKTGNVQFFIQGDTTHTLTTPADTISFVSVATPQTLVKSQNGAKFSICNLQFSANTKGTFNLDAFTVRYKQKSGTVFTQTNNNIGTVTVDSINVTKGYISGSFLSTITVASNTANVVGVFTIQQ
ncbi:hypothetical protein KXQ82_17450 [Mucilaginibacter sp. HMF5004]|uniref:hypothetical protein n=1 Tax=Mucilaginibacter rivuli TaxID=2857527 RepID=UPI001C5F1E38|nr:hypothetical protein [Mucilaginibacter rivuli]MBW4891517.1 hypothetical protein [Mucilaginibacter rivuli]